jgi:hypothetical protein
VIGTTTGRLAALALAAGLGGCSLATQPLAVALAGAGTSSAIGHSLNGTAYRTFTATLEEVKTASLETLSAMGIRIDSFETVENGELITGSAIRRSVEIELEPISSKATRMRVVTRNGGIFFDGSTATEIVMQTEKALGANDLDASAGAGRRLRY